MKLIEFPEQTLVIAKDQPEYQPLPAFLFANDPTGRVVCCWQLTLWERLRLLFTGKLWHQIMTFHQPLQPQLVQLEKPFTPEDHAAALAAKAESQTRQDFEQAMREKYGRKIAVKNMQFDRQGYHPNDRRRCIVFEPADFARAQELKVFFVMGCRIADENHNSAVK